MARARARPRRHTVAPPRPGTKRHLREATANLRDRGLLPPEPPAPYDARAALKRSGFAARDDAAETAALARSIGSRTNRYLEGDSTLRAFAPSTLGELVVWGFAALIGLALLDVALRGRGPAGVERVLGLTGKAVRKLVSPDDPLIGGAEPPAGGIGGFFGRIAAVVGTAGAAASAGAAGVTRAGVYPLGKRGPIIGTPHAGTHTLGNWQSDNAVDVAVPVGTPVYAVTDGTICAGCGFGPSGQGGRFAGSRLTLDASSGGQSFFYAHLSRLVVRRGERVRAGQLLGYSGSANGVAHLHFAAESGSVFRWIQARLQQLAEAAR